jgi:thioredoxin reductase
MTLEGMDVVCVLEKLPHLSGLVRNKNQCLDDYDIPLHLCRTVIDIQGKNRLERVLVADVDASGNAISNSEYFIDCDTLIMSVGLIPENELARACGVVIDENSGGPVVNSRLETSVSGIFCAGNSLQVHSLVDYVSVEGEKAGLYAAEYAAGYNSDLF